MRFLRLLLLPIAGIYSCVVFVRNRLYDWGILKSQAGALPTIIVGNIAVGGTGKTPHVEYLIRLLQSDFRLTFLSRGYGRATKGFVAAAKGETAQTIGDEPYQVHKKFPDIPVAVCEDRLAGLQLLRSSTTANLAILDDAFQHRRLRGDFNILLTDYNKPWWNDINLPTGTLRDNIFEKRRAQVIIVTKCPAGINEKEMAEIRNTIWAKKDQPIFFTSIVYGQPVQLRGPARNPGKESMVLGFAGIARPALFEQYLKANFRLRKFKSFSDHHIFSHEDIQNLWSECDTFDDPTAALFTTEKDAMRIMSMDGMDDTPIFYIPMEIKFVKDENLFRKTVMQRFVKEQ